MRIARALSLLALALTVAADPEHGLPKIPPLPAASFPEPAAAEPFARELIGSLPAERLAMTLQSNQELMPGVLRNLGTALLSSDATLQTAVEAYLGKLVLATSRSADPHRREDVQRVVTVAVLDPLRYDTDPRFRARINTSLPAHLSGVSRPIAAEVLDEMTRTAGLDFETGEAIAVARGLAPRKSAARRVAFTARSLEFADDVSGPIEASIFSLGSPFVTPVEARTFLQAVHAANPRRHLLVLADRTTRSAIGGVTYLDTHGRSFTPWPRDPFLAARNDDGGVVFVNRPNAQRTREEDQNMVRTIVESVPQAIDDRWNTRWTVSPVAFHNGHILPGPATVWISMHTVEPRALAILGLDRVPVETFHDREAVERYFVAVRRAASELEDLYRRPVRFVHPLTPDVIDALLGGGGFDLDSIVTILPPSAALVGDIGLGTAAARRSPAAEWTRVQSAYHLRAGRDAVLAAQTARETLALQRFLDVVAAEMKRQGMTVRRLPLLNVPTSLVALEDVPQDSSFLITWNNVVLERRRAEGFASLLASIDADVRRTFAASGYGLQLYPPLTHSIVLGGGYRCASNHVRPKQKTLSPPQRGEGGRKPGDEN